MQTYGFADVFRELNGQKKQFTWHKRGGAQRARLDMFLASQSLVPFIKKFQVLPSYKSDHRPISIELDFSSFTRGKGYWKLNDSLLTDVDYVNEIKKTISITCAKYVKHHTYEIFFQSASEFEINSFMEKSPEELQLLEFNVNPNVLMEQLLNDIRNTSITYSIKKNEKVWKTRKYCFKILLNFKG